MPRIMRKNVTPEANLENVKEVQVNQKGIDNIKHLLAFLFSIAYATEKVVRDGKFKIHEVFYYRDSIKKLNPAVKGIKEIKAEISDLTTEEVQDLVEYISGEFKLPNKEVEAKIEDLIRLGAEFIKLIV